MRVAITPSYGPPSILQIAEAPKPHVGAHDVLVRVHSSPVTAGDRRVRSADFPGVSAVIGRLMLGVTGPRHAVQGTMFAGRVVAVGEAVSRFAVGDDVFGSADHGAYAEYLAVSEESSVATMPPGVGYDEAAAVPYGAGTALHFLRDLAAVQPGEKVLVLGASGGVGRYAVQLAKHLGAEVTAVCSRGAFEGVRALGADLLLDHRTEDFTLNGQRYDVIFDIADASSFRHSRGSLTATGRYMTLYISVPALLAVAWTALVGGPKALFAVVLGAQERTEELRELLAQGVIQPVFEAHFPLERLADAHALAEQGVHGEVMVDIVPQALRPVVQSA
jgi:NADPH:quinone reductase-like Zn-dependent oxidoreductase